MSDRVPEAKIVVPQAPCSRRVQATFFHAGRQIDDPVVDAVVPVDLLPDHEKPPALVDLTFIKGAGFRVIEELPGRFLIDDTTERIVGAFHTQSGGMHVVVIA